MEESEDERFDDMSDTAPPVELPPCELSRLEEINEVSPISLIDLIVLVRKDEVCFTVL